MIWLCRSLIVVLLLCLGPIHVTGVIKLLSFGERTYIQSGVDVNITWTYTDDLSKLGLRTWYFSNTSTPIKQLSIIFADGNPVKGTSSPLPNTEVHKPATLVLKNVSMDYNGTYRFEITLNDGSPRLHSDVLVIITEQPIAIVNCSAQTILKEGESISCLCSSNTGNPPPTASWSSANDTVVSGPGYLKSNLVLTNVTKEHTGTYTCNVQSHNLKDETTIKVTVNHKPEIPTLSLNVSSLTLNIPVTISCIANGYPQPNFTLLHNGTIIPSLKNVKEVMHIITSVSYDNGGKYECQSVNILGNSTISIDLVVTVTGRVPPTTTPSPSERKSTTTGKGGVPPTTTPSPSERKSTTTGKDNKSSSVQCDSSTESYIFILVFLGGLICGMILLYGILLFRRCLNKKEKKSNETTPEHDYENAGAENVLTYQELDVSKMKSADENYQSLEMNKRNVSKNEEVKINEESGYAELNEVRGNKDDNYQSLNRV